jgi:hypothetical protein
MLANNAKEGGDDCTHILSKVSRTLGRDTFVFWPSVPARLLVGERMISGSEV